MSDTYHFGSALRWVSSLANAATLSLASLGACGGDVAPGVDAPLVAVPFKALGSNLAVWDGRGYQPLFIKGVNLGVAVPGTQAGELAATREQYDRWLAQMGEMGFNAVRIYTLHYPRFYDALRKYNLDHPAAPIYLLHGAWLDEENPSGDLFDLTNGFDAGIAEVVDCAHGRSTIAERRGRAHGSYVSDVSPWIVGWIVGREIAPREVELTNAAHPEVTAWAGRAVSLENSRPLEAWFAQRLDGLVLYERARYGVERPISVSSWPTLDPLRHPTERGGEDAQSFDLEAIDTTGAPAGYFASYHAYPYYPDFMTRTGAYAAVHDRQGPNGYMGYLLDLKRHYASHPLVIAEFGVPSSWGNAHDGAAGMNHGGENEIEQGVFDARLMNDIFDAHCAGGAVFAWIDEWWKRTWIVDELSLPRERYRLWHNVASPEQNFGMVAFEETAPRFDRFSPVLGNGRIARLEADASAAFFHLRLTLSAPLSSADVLTVGFDTYRDDAGETILPGGISTARRSEFALVLEGASAAQLYVTAAYDLFGIWHGTSSATQLYHSVASDGGAWAKVRWQNNAAAQAEDGSAIPPGVDEVGRLVVRAPGAAATSRDAISFDGTNVEIRLPWTLLQFADPSTRSVIDDERMTPERETRTSEGVAVVVHLGNDHLESARFRWEGWERAPATTERLKAGAGALSEALRALP